MKNGVKLVDLLGIIHRLQSTEGTSAAHCPARVLRQAWTSSPSWVRMRGFKRCSIILLARSTCLVCAGVGHHSPIHVDVIVVTEV
jgi:hypothetical protein